MGRLSASRRGTNNDCFIYLSLRWRDEHIYAASHHAPSTMLLSTAPSLYCILRATTLPYRAAAARWRERKAREEEKAGRAGAGRTGMEHWRTHGRHLSTRKCSRRRRFCVGTHSSRDANRHSPIISELVCRHLEDGGRTPVCGGTILQIRHRDVRAGTHTAVLSSAL